MFVLRDYQQGAVDSIAQYFATNNGNPLIAMPTGTGKSLVIAGFLKEVYRHYPTQRIMMLTHVKELIDQNADKLRKLWPVAPLGIYSAGLGKKELHRPITFAGIGSVVKKAALFGHIDLIMIDEAHLVSPSQGTMYQKFIADLKTINPMLKVIGLTATPYRLKQGKLTEEDGLFTHVCYDLTTIEAFNKLIDDGYILPLKPKQTRVQLDIEGVHMRGGEFIAKELQSAVNQEEVTRAALTEVLEHSYDRHSWLIFAAGVEHAVDTQQMLEEMGVSCAVVHSGNKVHKMSSKQRDANIEAFKNGEITALINNNVLTTGFDHPGLDLIIMLRPTASPGLWVQMLGRGTRPVYEEGFDLTTLEGRMAAIQQSPKQDCLVLDFAGNTKRLGPINDPVVPNRRKKGPKGDAPIKECDSCGFLVHASLKNCPYCGYEFKFETKLKQSASTDELIKTEVPVIEDLPVDNITYTLHKKLNKPDSVRVSYYCGLRKPFVEFVCIEHSGYAKRRAMQWWRERSTGPVPLTTAEALERTQELQPTISIRAHTNKKYPEIIAHFYW